MEKTRILAEMVNMGKEQQLEYQASLKSYRDLKVVMDQKLEQGKIAGEAIGFEKGELIGELKKSKSVLIKILTKKFPNLEQNIINGIEAIQDIKLVDDLIDKSFEIINIDQLNDILLKNKNGI